MNLGSVWCYRYLRSTAHILSYSVGAPGPVHVDGDVDKVRALEILAKKMTNQPPVLLTSATPSIAEFTGHVTY